MSHLNPVHIVTPSSLEVVTITEAKEHLKIDGDEQNAILRLYLSAAIKACEDYRQAAIGSAEHELHSSWFCPSFSLQKYPVSAINSVKYYDEEGNLQTVDSANYRLQSFRQPCYLEFDSEFDYPDLHEREYPVVVNFNAGWTSASSVPATVKLGILNRMGTFNEIRQISAIANGLTKVEFEELSNQLLDAETMWI